MALTKVDLANTVEGILPVANGGTGTSTGVSPGGSTTQVQYNNAGAFAGSSGLTYNGTTLTITGSSPIALNGATPALAMTDTTWAVASYFQPGVNTGGTGTGNYFMANVPTGKGFTWAINNSSQMLMDSSGNLGIGTTSPATKLVVQEASANDATLVISGGGNNNAYLRLSNTNSGQLCDIYSSGGKNMVFRTNGSTEAMRLTANGGVSFGTSGTAYGTSGQVLKSNGDAAPSWTTVAGPAFSAYQNSGQTPSTSTWTKINFQVEEFDTNSNFASSTFTPTVAGYYQISANYITTSTGGTTQIISIYKNGSSYKQGTKVISYGENGHVSTLVYMNGSTDYLEAYMYIGGTRTTAADISSTWFNGCFIRGA